MNGTARVGFGAGIFRDLTLALLCGLSRAAEPAATRGGTP
jgi:hypothetical protein